MHEVLVNRLGDLPVTAQSKLFRPITESGQNNLDISDTERARERAFSLKVHSRIKRFVRQDVTKIVFPRKKGRKYGSVPLYLNKTLHGGILK